MTPKRMRASSSNTPSIFDGDGRENVHPTNVPAGTVPTDIRKSSARKLIATFFMSGLSFHSSSGSTLWVLVTACLEDRCNFTIANPEGKGFTIALKEEY